MPVLVNPTSPFFSEPDRILQRRGDSEDLQSAHPLSSGEAVEPP